MSEPTHDERFFALTEALAAEQPADLDVDAWARRFHLQPADVRRARAALAFLGEPETEAAPALAAPPTLPDDYELTGEIGRGGMGVVYRAHQRSLDREVAIKVLMPGEFVFGEALRRFRREAQSLARLRHRHIVAIHDVGESGGHVYYTMDLIEGANLAQLVKDEELTVARTVRLMRQVTSAVAYVHEHGLIHRDLKPANVLVDEAGDAYVVDFGLARDLAVGGDLTVTGNILGTPAYMAPEQARGDTERIGERSDVYALGAILYECLTGRAPFGGLALAELVHAVIHDDPRPPSQLAPRVPRELEWVCLKALAKEPEQRYPTARALLEDLERFEEGRGVRAQAPSLGRRLVRVVRRERTAVVSVCATLVLAIGAFVLARGTRPVEDHLVRRAEQLRTDGATTAAGELFEELLAEGRNLNPEQYALALEARLARAAQAGEVDARALRTSVLEDGLARIAEARPDERLALRARVLCALAALGDDARLAEQVKTFSAEQRSGRARSTAEETVWHGEHKGQVASAPGPRAGDGVVETLIDDLARDLARREPIAQRLAWALFETNLGDVLLARLQGREGVRALAGLVAGAAMYASETRLERLAAGRDVAAWVDALARLEARPLLDELLALEGSLALDLACALVDLPWVSRYAGEDWPDPALVRAELGALRGLQFGASRQRRIAFAIEHALHAPASVTYLVDRWLTSRTGWQAPRRSGARQNWAAWRATHSGSTEELASALDVDPQPLSVLAAFQVERDPVRRRALHELLRLQYDGSEPPPRHTGSELWCEAVHEPALLAETWTRILGGPNPFEDLHVVFTSVRWDGSSAEPTLAWVRNADIDARGVAALEHSHALLGTWVSESADERRYLDGSGLTSESTDHVTLSFACRTRWSPRGPRVVHEEPTFAPFAAGTPFVSRGGPASDLGNIRVLCSVAEGRFAPLGADGRLRSWPEREDLVFGVLESKLDERARPLGEFVAAARRRLFPNEGDRGVHRAAHAAGHASSAEERALALARVRDAEAPTRVLDAIRAARRAHGFASPDTEFDTAVERRSHRRRTRIIVFAALGGFVALSLLMGFIGGYRSLRRQGIARARIAFVAAICVLFSAVTLALVDLSFPVIPTWLRFANMIVLIGGSALLGARLRGLGASVPALAFAGTTALYVGALISGDKLWLATTGVAYALSIVTFAFPCVTLARRVPTYRTRQAVYIWLGMLLFVMPPGLDDLSLLLDGLGTPLARDLGLRVHALGRLVNVEWMRPFWFQLALFYFHATYQPEAWRHRKLTRPSETR